MGKTRETAIVDVIVNNELARKKVAELTAEFEGLRKKRIEALKSGDQELAKALQKEIAPIKKELRDFQKATIDVDQVLRKLNSVPMNQLQAAQRLLRSQMQGLERDSAQYLQTRQKLLRIEQEIAETAQKKSASPLGTLGRFAGGAAVIALLERTARKSIDIYQAVDEKMADVQKTTGLAKEEVRALDRELMKLDSRTSRTDLLDLARVGGKLGINGQDELVGFVRAADQIKVALTEDLGGDVEESIRKLGKLVDIFKIKGELGIEKSLLSVGSAINSLGAASTANEEYLVDFTNRTAGVAPSAGVSIQNVLGLGAAMDNLGQSAEVSGTTYSQVMTGMFKRTDQYAKVAGMSLKEFRDLLDNDANEAFLKFLEGVNGDGGMESITKRLASLKLEGTRSTQVLGALAGNIDLIRAQQALANEEFTKATSLTEEFSTKNATATATMEKRRKALDAEREALGERLFPLWSDAVGLQGNMLRALNACVGVFIEYKGAIIGLTTSLAAYLVMEKARHFWSGKNRLALIAEVKHLNSASVATKMLAVAKNLLAGNIKAAAAAAKMLAGSFGWISLVAAAITGLAFYLKKYVITTDEARQALLRLTRASEEFAASTASEQALIDTMFERLKKATKGTKDYAAAKKAIMDKYGHYLTGLDRETQSLNKVTEAYQAISQAARDSINERMRAQLTTEAGDAFGKGKASSYESIKEGLAKAFRGNEGLVDNLFPQIREALEQENISQRPDLTVALGGVQSAVRKNYNAPQTLAIMGRITKGIRQYVETLQVWENTIKQVDDDFRPLEGKSPGSQASGSDAEPASGTTNPAAPTGSGKGSWTPDKDTRYLKEKMKLRQQFMDGEIRTEAELNARLLDIEIAAIQRRIDLHVDEGQQMQKLRDSLSAKQLQKAKADKSRLEKLQAAASEGSKKDTLEQQVATEKNRYKRQLEELGLFNVQREKLTSEELAALENLERIHQGNMQAIFMDTLLKQLGAGKEAGLRKIDLLKQEHNRALVAADTYEKRMALLRELYQGQSLPKIRSSAEAERLLKKKYQSLEEEELRSFLQTQVAVYTKFQEELQHVTVDGVDLGPIDQEEADRLQAIIDDLNKRLAALRSGKPATGNDQPVNVDILGYTPQQWEELFKHISEGEQGFRKWEMALGAIANAYGEFDQLLGAMENRQLKNQEKSASKKKKVLDKQLKSNAISQERYNALTQQLDEETDRKKAEIERKQAIRQKAFAAFNILANTALAIMKLWVNPGFPLAPALASMVGAIGAVQLATVMAAPIPGAQEGGPIDVVRSQDGKKFRARHEPDQRGYVDKPTVLVSEDGPEYVVPHAALKNPSIRPVLDVLERSRQSGTLATINLPAVLEGRAAGGYVGAGTVRASGLPERMRNDNQSINEELKEVIRESTRANAELRKQLQRGIQAQVNYLGKGGIKEKQERYQRIVTNSKL